MNVLRIFSGKGWLAAWTVLLAGFLLAGCQTSNTDTYFSDVPVVVAGGSGTAQVDSEIFRVGELVIVRFSGVSSPPPTHEERIKEDGTITLPDVGAVTAANKTPGELQRELTEAFRRFYNNLVVTVVSEGRHYYVGGQVRQPGPKAYLGKTTVTTAIQAAGDFTEFANRKKVMLVRPGQKPVTVNVVQAQKDSSKDLVVLPGDRIDVPRRFY